MVQPNLVKLNRKYMGSGTLPRYDSPASKGGLQVGNASYPGLWVMLEFKKRIEYGTKWTIRWSSKIGISHCFQELKDRARESESREEWVWREWKTWLDRSHAWAGWCLGLLFTVIWWLNVCEDPFFKDQGWSKHKWPYNLLIWAITG